MNLLYLESFVTLMLSITLFLSGSTYLEHCTHRTKEHYVSQVFLQTWTIKHAVIIWNSGYVIVLLCVCAYVLLYVFILVFLYAINLPETGP